MRKEGRKFHKCERRITLRQSLRGGIISSQRGWLQYVIWTSCLACDPITALTPLDGVCPNFVATYYVCYKCAGVIQYSLTRSSNPTTPTLPHFPLHDLAIDITLLDRCCPHFVRACFKIVYQSLFFVILFTSHYLQVTPHPSYDLSVTLSSYCSSSRSIV